MMVETCVVLRNGLIVDGTGAAPFLGEVVLRQARTASVIPAGATGWTVEPLSVVDCSGKVVAPGFIDAHSHSDLQILEHRTEKLLQGVTSEVVGNCGFSPYPAPENPQELREFANGILCGDETWKWSSAADYLSSAQQSKTASVASLVAMAR